MSLQFSDFEKNMKTDGPNSSDKSLSLKEKAYQAIRDAILRHELKPHTQLSEAGLAEKFGISRTPVREAFKRLEEERLIRVIPRQGAFVTDISVEDIAQIYQLREALECFSIQYVPGFAAPNELDMLISDVKDSFEWIKTNEIERINDLDIHLHRFIASSSQNQLIIRLVDQLLNQIIRLRLMTPTMPGRLKQQAEEHLQIVNALKDGDIESARSALRTHIQNVRNTFLQMRLGVGITNDR